MTRQNRTQKTLWDEVSHVLENGLAAKREEKNAAAGIKFAPLDSVGFGLAQQVAEILDMEGDEEKKFNARYDTLRKRKPNLPKFDSAYRQFKDEITKACKTADREFQRWYANAKMRDLEQQGRQ